LDRADVAIFETVDSFQFFFSITKRTISIWLKMVVKLTHWMLQTSGRWWFANR